MANKPSKPHDEFFKATFGRKDIAVDYLQNMLPPTLLQELDLTKLERVNGSYVSPELQETFSDVVYLCPLKNGWYAVQITFIFEHKSKVESRPHLQLLRYMLDAWSAQLMQIKSEKQKKRATLNPIVPILVYQGRENWKKRSMSSYFGQELPQSLLAYLPQFDYVFTHVTAMSNEQILELGKGLLINTFLMMKHIWKPMYILQHPQLIFINLEEPRSVQDFIVIMLAYFYKNSELAKETIQQFNQALPHELNQYAMSTYDMILAEGMEIATERERGIYEVILAKEHQRAEEERQRAEEEYQRAEKERQRINNAILYLHQIDQKQPAEIAMIIGKDLEYVENLIAEMEEGDWEN